MNTPILRLIRQGSTGKLGATSTGQIHYAILIDAEAELYLALTGNDSGGYFGREAVTISALRACVEANPVDTPLRAAVVRPAYTSRSTNQGGFCAAALCAEGLITRVVNEKAGRGQLLADTGRWDEWTRATLAALKDSGADLPVFHIGKQPAETAADAGSTNPADGGDIGAVADEHTVIDSATPQQPEAAAQDSDGDAAAEATPPTKPRRKAKAKA